MINSCKNPSQPKGFTYFFIQLFATVEKYLKGMFHENAFLFINMSEKSRTNLVSMFKMFFKMQAFPSLVFIAIIRETQEAQLVSQLVFSYKIRRTQVLPCGRHTRKLNQHLSSSSASPAEAAISFFALCFHSYQLYQVLMHIQDFSFLKFLIMAARAGLLR